LATPVKEHEIESDAPCCIPAPGLSLHAAATAAAAAAAASVRGCQFWRGRSFGLSFEHLCSLEEYKKKYKGHPEKRGGAPMGVQIF
jgi:hypothetical protein